MEADTPPGRERPVAGEQRGVLTGVEPAKIRKPEVVANRSQDRRCPVVAGMPRGHVDPARCRCGVIPCRPVVVAGVLGMRRGDGGCAARRTRPSPTGKPPTVCRLLAALRREALPRERRGQRSLGRHRHLGLVQRPRRHWRPFPVAGRHVHCIRLSAFRTTRRRPPPGTARGR
jgi:hypothetical protein